MEINVPLPYNSSINTYKELKNYLKQFELAIHYAQKSVENMEKEGYVLSEDTFVAFRHPSLEKNIEDDKYSELQYVELQINLA